MFRLYLICLFIRSTNFHPFNQFKQEIKPEPDSQSGVKKGSVHQRSNELCIIRFTSVNPPPPTYTHTKWFNLYQSVFCGGIGIVFYAAVLTQIRPNGSQTLFFYDKM